MELDFINQGPASYDAYENLYQDLFKKIFDHFGITRNYFVEVNIVDNKTIHGINKEYRNVDRPTDVISFAFLDDENELIPDDGSPISLGEIIISFEKAEEQAKELGHSLNREMSFLFTHGMLHLLGYDHMNKHDEMIMFNLQDEILGGLKMDSKELIAKAKEARQLSYSPYSHFAVGAAVLCKDGSVFVGANIENSSYPLCMCAERNAIYNAYMHGKKKGDFVAMALSADTDEPCSPCGACRQVISELFPKKSPIYMSNLRGDVQETNIDELLPYAFSEEDLK